VTALSGLGILTAAPPASAADSVARPVDGVFVVDGRGFGHGRGLSQYGAYGAAVQGLQSDAILRFYYPEAQLGSAAGSLRRVLLTAEDADLDVVNVPGLRLRDAASGASVEVGASAIWSRVRVRHDPAAGLVAEGLAGGRWVPVRIGGSEAGVLAGHGVFEGPPTLTVQQPAGTRTYRGRLVAARSGQAARPLYVVNHVVLDDYIRGVVPAEMPASWPREALEAQAVAARSYGMQPCPQPGPFPATALYDVVDTVSCQVYGGVGGEHPASDAAVAATAGQVLRTGAGVLRAEFSSSNGGWTSPGAGAPVAREDPYDEVGARAGRSSVHRWTGVAVPAAKLEAAFGTGPLQSISVLAREGHGEWGGRVLRVRLGGASRTVEVTGAQLRTAAGLRSTWFDLVPKPASDIDALHARLGGPGGFLGPAVGAEVSAPDGSGRYRHYRGGSVYWSPATGAHEVHGAIRGEWARLRWEAGPLGYPTTDETATPDGRGRYNHFQGGSVYWTPSTGAHEVRGSIRQAWARLRWEAGSLGYPVSPELVTSDRRGRRSEFQGGSIYWSPETGAFEVRGSLRDEWLRRGGERGLGYPTSDEYAVPGGRASDFQRGRLVWDRAMGRVSLVAR
jgi:stage II sporulation protein D